MIITQDKLDVKKSINNKIWVQKITDETYISELIRNFGISDLLARILSNKVKNINEISRFLSPKIKDNLPYPFHLLDMDIAVERTIKAIVDKQRICIFGDYDVDGATSSALLKNVFRDLDIDSYIYIPDRIIEGYGPNIESIKKFKQEGVDLVITVDCGTTSYAPLKFAKEIGLDVIVIDHHLSGELPEAVAIINPNRIDESSECKNLAAVGVSFLFAVALINKLKQNNFFDSGPLPDLMQYLDLVALGSVCDMMSLTGVNRSFVAAGLKVINMRKNIGIKALLEIANAKDKITTYHLGFVLGPRINAGGRVGKSDLGARLLSTTSEAEAQQLSIELNQHNDERKIIEERIMIEAIEIAASQMDNNCLIVSNEGWHAGIIGIIASKLKEKFYKPAIVISIEGEISKASCRSIKNIDLGSKIVKARENGLLLSGGGHSMAAAFTCETSKLDEIKNFLNKAIKNEVEASFINNVEEYELELSTTSINLELLNELSKLEPFGNGNPEPIVKLTDLFILKADILAGKHIRCLLAPSRKSYGSKSIKAMLFNVVGSNFEEVLLSKIPRIRVNSVDIKSKTIGSKTNGSYYIKSTNSMSFIGNLKVNNWQKSSTVEFYIRDIIL